HLLVLPPPALDNSTHHLHDALRISSGWTPRQPASSSVRVSTSRWSASTSPTKLGWVPPMGNDCVGPVRPGSSSPTCSTYSSGSRSEEHTSEHQSRENLVCRLLLAKK